MRKGSVKYRLFALAMLILGLFSMCIGVSALDQVDLNREVSLSLHVTEDNPETGAEQSLVGVSFRLYRVATLNEDMSYSLTDPFKASAVDVNKVETADEARDTALILEAFIDRQGIASNLTAVSDESGVLTFADMKPGLFLVLASPIEAGGYVYAFSPVMVALPQLNATKDSWLYDITSEIKMERNEGTIDLRVIKRWELDYGAINNRPEYIEVIVLRDGKAVSSVRLNSSNGWQAVFRNLSAVHKWTVEEASTPAGYKVSYSDITYDTDGNAAIVITNRFITPPSIIIQTGLLWWPVPVLLAAGAMLMLAGWLLIRKGKRRYE